MRNAQEGKMKILVFLSLFAISALACSDKAAHQDSGGKVQQQEESVLGVPKGIQTDHEQEIREEQSNDDFDPELNAIDDEYAPKEGIHDD